MENIKVHRVFTLNVYKANAAAKNNRDRSVMFYAKQGVLDSRTGDLSLNNYLVAMRVIEGTKKRLKSICLLVLRRVFLIECAMLV